MLEFKILKGSNVPGMVTKGGSEEADPHYSNAGQQALERMNFLALELMRDIDVHGI